MLKTILIGLDGTRDSDPALEYGLQLAKRFDTLVVGCGVVDEPGVRVSEATLFAEGYFAAGSTSMLSDARRAAKQTLDHFSTKCQRAGVRSRSLLDSGTPHVQIVAEAHRHDLVVLGCHTHFELGWRGSDDATLQHVLQECARPVIVVPSGSTASVDGPIVLAFDGSVRASRALYDLVASGIGRGRSIHILSIDRDAAVANRVAARAVDFLRHHEIEATPHAFDGAFPAAEVVLGSVERLSATMLVIGAYAHTAFREFFLGSTTRSVMTRAAVPVFCSR